MVFVLYLRHVLNAKIYLFSANPYKNQVFLHFSYWKDLDFMEDDPIMPWIRGVEVRCWRIAKCAVVDTTVGMERVDGC